MRSLDEIVASFELMDDWEQRYEYLVHMGEQLPSMADTHKTEDNRVKACMSKVWVHASPNSADNKRIHYQGDCDTSIIKGVLALLIELVQDKTVAEIEVLDLDEIFQRLHLDEHLSPNRHIGIYAIVELMKAQSRACARAADQDVA